ncbi:MAG: lysylphosphatidylglycerol synthase transmembrane domain-containing protein [Bacteroidota bacterium]|nr:lysylphosphatidylglycerol synthase transmembrane domain-containing protein [Bacteroidota bacterium]
MNLKQLITYAAFLAIGVFLLTKLTEFVDDKEALIEKMSSAPFWAVSVTLTMGLLAVFSRGIRWNLLLNPMGYKASTTNAVAAVAFGYLANIFLPRSGEVARCAALNSTDDVPVDKLIGTVITERVVDILMLLILLTIAFITNFDAVLGLFSSIQIPGGSALFVLALAIGVFSIGGYAILKRKNNKSKILKFIRGIGDGVKSVQNMERKIWFILHTLFIWIMYYLMAFVIFISMDGLEDLGVFQGLWVMVSGGFGMLFPSPGGIGSYQGAVMLGFESIGYDKVIGLAVGHVVWLTQTAMLILAGAVGYFHIIIARLNKSKA